MITFDAAKLLYDGAGHLHLNNGALQLACIVPVTDSAYFQVSFIAVSELNVDLGMFFLFVRDLRCIQIPEDLEELLESDECFQAEEDISDTKEDREYGDRWSNLRHV